MKIGIDGRALTKNRAGIGTYTYENLKELAKMDKNNEYYVYSNKDIDIDFKLNENWHLRKMNSKIGTLWLYFLLPKQLKKDEIDVFWGTQHCLPKRNRYTKKIKYLLTIHDIAIEKFKGIGSFYNTMIQKIFLRKSCKNADKIIAVSKSTKNDLVEMLNINKDKIEVVYLGIRDKKEIELNEKDNQEITEKYKLENSKFIFFLSTIEPRKNLDTAIKAFENYKEQNKDNLKFVISGGIGWKCNNTLQLIENSKYKEDIIRTGYITIKEKAYFFKNCEAFIYPSLYEGFGIPVLEAMQNGALVITTNISSLPEVGGKVAFYIKDVYDKNELSDKIKEVINIDEQQKKAIIEQGYEQIKKFTWEKSAKAVLSNIET